MVRAMHSGKDNRSDVIQCGLVGDREQFFIHVRGGKTSKLFESDVRAVGLRVGDLFKDERFFAIYVVSQRYFLVFFAISALMSRSRNESKKENETLRNTAKFGRIVT